MPITELNPNHPVTQKLREHWHAIVALLVVKYGTDGEVVITKEDIASIPKDCNIIVQEREDGLHISLTDTKTAMELARTNGGLPQ